MKKDSLAGLVCLVVQLEKVYIINHRPQRYGYFFPILIFQPTLYICITLSGTVTPLFH